MHTILLMFLLVMIGGVSLGLRRRREHRRAERAKALRYERSKARRQRIPHVSANLCGSSPEPTALVSRPPPFREFAEQSNAAATQWTKMTSA